MIVGNGDIANVLPDRNDLVFFASGVSNSQEKDELKYRREKILLLDQDPNKHLVYFSSLGVFDKEGRYYDHKREMEIVVKAVIDKYTIIRLGNIDWGINPYTFINAYNNSLKGDRPFVIRNEYKQMVNREEFLHWINLIPNWNCEMNIPGQRMTVKRALKIYGNA